MALGLQGLGSQSFPSSMASSGVTWFGKKGIPADVPCLLGTSFRTPSSTPNSSLCVMSQPCPSPNGLSHTQRCHHGEVTPTLKDLALRESQLTPRSRFWGTTPTWGHPTQHLTPHELGVVLWPPGLGDTCPANPGMSPATSWGCSRCEGSARKWQGWRYPPSAPVPRWRMGTLWGGSTCPGRAWGHSGIRHMSQHKMGTCQGFGSMSQSHQS